MDYTIRMLSDKEDYEMKQKMIDFLLENANPSIQLRVKKEILKNLSKQEEERLQGQILLKNKTESAGLGRNVPGS